MRANIYDAFIEMGEGGIWSKFSDRMEQNDSIFSHSELFLLGLFLESATGCRLSQIIFGFSDRFLSTIFLLPALINVTRTETRHTGTLEPGWNLGVCKLQEFTAEELFYEVCPMQRLSLELVNSILVLPRFYQGKRVCISTFVKSATPGQYPILHAIPRRCIPKRTKVWIMSSRILAV